MKKMHPEMEYLSVNEIAEKWNITHRRVQKLCDDGRIDGACRLGRAWLIPRNSEKPIDPRKKSVSNLNDNIIRTVEQKNNEVLTREVLENYVLSKNYLEILNYDLTPWIFEEVCQTSFPEIAVEISRCYSSSIKKPNIIAMLRVALALLAGKKYIEFDRLMSELKNILDDETNDKNKCLLKAEWHLLCSWRKLPDLTKMIKHAKQAADLFDGSYSQIITPSFPWGFGVHTQLSLFHHTAGKADMESDQLTEFLKIYIPITQGHGTAADILMQAEIAHWRGDLQLAEMLSYQASFMAQSKNQTVIQLGAAFQLAEVAIQKPDMMTWGKAINFMEQAIDKHTTGSFFQTEVELIHACLLSELNLPDMLPDWIKVGKISSNLPFHHCHGFWFCHTSYLMQKKEFAQLAGCTTAFLNILPTDNFYLKSLFTLLSAIGYFGLGDKAKSEYLLQEATEKLIADDFLFLLVAYQGLLEEMPERLVRNKYPKHLSKYLEIKNRLMQGYVTLRQEYGETWPSDLTVREREVAVLASKGLSNVEISEKLMITENTVKYHLRNIFQKLYVDRRSKLAEKLNVL